ncbi:MAG: hypothetical protein ACOC3C_07985, partial [Candidatus Thorarchaeota archaeon]
MEEDMANTEGLELLDERMRTLIGEVKNDIVSLRMIGLREEEEFDEGYAINEIFRVSYDAKQKTNQLQELIDQSGFSNYQSRLWKIDDERSFEAWEAWVRVQKRKRGIPISSISLHPHKDVFVYDGCEVMGNRFVYSLTIKNNTLYVITNVTSTLVGFPRDCMRLVTDKVKQEPRLGAGELLTEKFILTPSKDCVEGRLICSVSYIDHRDHLNSVRIAPYTITSVCDLLRPLEATSKQMESTFEALVCSDRELQLNWNVEILLDKAKKILPAMNFYLVDVNKKEVGNLIKGQIRGFALGKYTSKRVAVVINLAGEKNQEFTDAKVEVLGDDLAMLPTTMEELIDKISAWVCLGCGVRLNPDQVMKIEARETYQCRYCGHVLTLD